MRLLIQYNTKDKSDPFRAGIYYNLLKEIHSVIKEKRPTFIGPEIMFDCDHEYGVVGKFSNGTFEIRCSKCADSHIIPINSQWSR